MSEEIRVDVANAKYTVVIPPKGGLHALRYSEPWRDCCGDNLIFNLAYELHEARKKIEELENKSTSRA